MGVNDRLAALVARLPKVELHVHLEGSMPPRTLLELARRRGVALPATTEEGVREWFRFRNFDHFVEIYLACSACLVDPQDFYDLAFAFLAEQARQNVVYTEAHFTIGTHLANGCDGEAIREALGRAADDAHREHGVRLGLIPDIVRNVPEQADVTLEWALAGMGRGVVALGLSGTEATHDSRPFADHFAEAERAGLRRVAHAGEHGGPDAVWSALEYARAERIGHGVRSIEDPVLVQHLTDERIPLEVCPSSNLCLGVAPTLADHPFDRLRRAGVIITVNSDDPPFFDTTVNDEYLRVAAAYGYGEEEIVDLVRAGIESAFLTEAEKVELVARAKATL
jgi:adenosine deaminase